MGDNIFAAFLVGLLCFNCAHAQQEQVTDIIFAVDGSFSIGPSNFEVVKNWIKNVTTRIASLDATGSTNFGVIQFSHWFVNRSIDNQPFIKTEIELGSIKNLTALFGFRTFTGKALNKTSRDFEDFGRPNASRFAVLFTDGKSNDPEDAVTNAQKLREKGVEVITVGVGSNVNVTELRAIASGNTSSDENVFTVNSFNDLNTLSNIIAQTIQTSIEEAGSSAAITTTVTSQPTTLPLTTTELIETTLAETTTSTALVTTVLSTTTAMTTNFIISTIETTKIDNTTSMGTTTTQTTESTTTTSPPVVQTTTRSTTTPALVENNVEIDDDEANNAATGVHGSSVYFYVYFHVIIFMFTSAVM